MDSNNIKDFIMSDYLKNIHKEQKSNRKKYSLDNKKYKLINYFQKVIIPIKMRHYYKHKKELDEKRKNK